MDVTYTGKWLQHCLRFGVTTKRINEGFEAEVALICWQLSCQSCCCDCYC
jgi:hypothetical protein